MEQNEPVNPTPDNPQTPPSSPPSQPSESAPPPPPVVETNAEAKQWATFVHLAALAGLIGVPFGNILGPLIIWLIKKDALTFVNHQGKEALNFQISCVIYALLMTPTLCFPPLFALLIFALVIVNLTFVILASISANKGQAYHYPITIRLIN